jgi:diguanylate cyclase (GGDEF)-like protein/PAS domain S-box-containing protein
MFPDRTQPFPPIKRTAWLLPVAIMPLAIVVSGMRPALLGSAWNILFTVLVISELTLTVILWKRWSGTSSQLDGVEGELSYLQRIVDVSRDAIIGVTPDGVIMSWNSGARAIYGYTTREALGSQISILFDNRKGQAHLLFEKVTRGEIVSQHEITHLKKGRVPIDVSLTICPIMDRKRITGASVVARDITERKRAAGSLAQQAAAMKASMDGMAIVDHSGDCIYLNDAYAKIFGYSDPQRLFGASWETFFFEEEQVRLKEEIMPAVWRDGSWRGEAMGLKLNGSCIPLEISISSVDGGGLVQVVRDITERKKAEEKLRDSSLKDDLTALFNRRGLLRQAAPYFNFARRQKEKLLLLFIDLDGMKRINDEFGHQEGDNALINTATILNRSFRSSDIVARLGGDEFAVLVTDLNANKDEAIRRLTENLKAYNGSEVCRYKLSFSIGVAALEPQRMTCFEELLEQADQAMYEQKRMKKRRESERNQLQQMNGAAFSSSSQFERGPIPFALSATPELYGGSHGTFDNAAIGMAVVSADGSWLQPNEALCKLIGYSEQELRATTFQKLTHADDLKQVQSYIQRVLEGFIQSHEQEKRYIHQDGRTVWVLWHVSLLKDSETGTQRLFFQVQDISDRKKAEEKLTQDALTSLPNRARFNDLLKLRLARKHTNKDQNFAVLLLDVDRFKLVNDSLGNSSGDQLLLQIAQRIQTCMRQGDVLSRVAGDEFAVLLDDVSGEEEACSVATRIQQALAISFNLFGQEVYVTMSIGVALGPGQGEISDILRDAETAMHHAKERGKARYEVFGRDMRGQVMSRLKMETDLRHACERDELFVDYQPIVSLETRRLVGFEALVRWRHPEFGLVPPKDFIPVAEESGQILKIGQSVLQTACRQARAWQNLYQGDAPLFVSVNLSVKQFNQPDLVEHIALALEDSKLPPRCLKLEITESVFTENIDVAVELLNRLRELGVQLSIDDFGTGYSSLSYLQRFPIDTLKIDRSFVHQMMENEENIAIVRTIVALAQNLGMDVVAEGVETEDQLALLRKLECEKGQGFLFSTPVNEEEAEELITARDLQNWERPQPLQLLEAREALVA